MGSIRQQGWFAQAGYKLAGLNLEIPAINNVELVGRFDSGMTVDWELFNPAIHRGIYLLFHEHPAL